MTAHGLSLGPQSFGHQQAIMQGYPAGPGWGAYPYASSFGPAPAGAAGWGAGPPFIAPALPAPPAQVGAQPAYVDELQTTIRVSQQPLEHQQ